MRTLSDLLNIPQRDEGYCFDMGYDCEKNGANEVNCHFSIFSSESNTKAWENGKRKAREELVSAPII